MAPSVWKEIPYHHAAVKTDPPTVTWEVNAVGIAVRNAIGNAVGSALNVLKALDALNALNAPPCYGNCSPASPQGRDIFHHSSGSSVDLTITLNIVWE